VKALVLAGGEGTRLRPLTYSTPKSLLPICNRPFLEHQLRLMQTHGITEAMLLTGYLAEKFGPFVERMAERGIALEVVREEAPLGTAGAVRNVLDRLAEDTIVFNGDVLTDLDLTALIAFHRDRDAVATLALTPVADASAYGLVPLDDEGRVQAFIEKPPPEIARRGGLINAGTYVLDPRVLADVPAGEMWSFEREVFPGLLGSGERVFGFASEDYWLDIGTQERYLQAHWDVLDGRCRSAEPLGRRHGNLLLAAGAEAPSSAGPAVLGPGARVDRGASVERAVLLDGAAVEAGATVRDCALGPGAIVAAGARIERAFLAAGERVSAA
jgi:mannose-1-phosphate guanylyltransferase